jgi:macrolide transport system ATP-binding/permease protein
VITLNYGAALWQHRAIEGRRETRHALQDLALQQVRADVADIAYGMDGDYLVKIAATNLQPDQEVFLMAPTVRAFVQVGRDWQEVPSQPSGAAAGSVVPLSRLTEFAYTIRPKLKSFEEQLAGYMHVRLTATMLIARSREPGENLFERVDDYYVYLKPHGADDADIARRNKWSTKPPLWIPMPAH